MIWMMIWMMTQMTLLKMQHNMTRLKYILLILIVSLSLNSAYALSNQIHFAAGMVSGSYEGGSESYSFTILRSLNIEYENIYNSRNSYILKSTLSVNGDTGKMVYYGTFFSRRFYIGPTGMIFDKANSDNSVISSPKWRFYTGWDVGLSQVILRETGQALTVLASLVDLGIHFGTIYQISKRFGVELSVGMSFGYGFSKDTVTGKALKSFLGTSYYF